MSGYWKQPAANAAAFTADGCLRTGDVGMFTPEGFLKIVDRKGDMGIVAGFAVFPNEVEAVASGCPGVAEGACIGVPDDKTGEAVKLIVVTASGAALSTEDLVARCRKETTAYVVPKTVRFIDALPKSTVGKILRRGLRDVPRANGSEDVAADPHKGHLPRVAPELCAGDLRTSPGAIQLCTEPARDELHAQPPGLGTGRLAVDVGNH